MHIADLASLAASSVLALSLQASAQLEVDFDETPEGVYSSERVRADWRGAAWVSSFSCTRAICARRQAAS